MRLARAYVASGPVERNKLLVARGYFRHEAGKCRVAGGSYQIKEVACMATVARESCVSEIGEIAGKLWHILDARGPLTYAKLVKEIDDAPRDLVMQALGWLAREDKLEIEE